MYIQKYVDSLIFVIKISQNVYSKIYWKFNIRSKDFRKYIFKNVYSKIYWKFNIRCKDFTKCVFKNMLKV